MEHAPAKSFSNIHNTFTIPFERSRMVYFASSVMKNIVISPARSRFPVKLIGSIAFRSASSACCLLKPVAVIIKYFLK